MKWIFQEWQAFLFLDLSQYMCAYAHAGEYVSQKIKINVAAMPWQHAN